MNGNHRPMRGLIASSLLVSLLGLSACGKNNEEAGQPASVDTAVASATAVAPAAQPASATPVAYTPPTADQLYQVIAPIALFPDKLVALVLAGSTYPGQITAANTWLAQNPNLKGQVLATSADRQSWDPSVKALTAFPAVLSQMATNITWTTSLGQAYYNDLTDVLNAIQVMRQRAQASGNLCTTSEMRVTMAKRTSAPADYTPAPATPHMYEGPAVIPPPPQTIVIAPVQPDVVYVPTYNPAVVYGAPVAVYPGYIYHPPVYGPGAVVTADVISFGVGVTIGAIFGHVGWGWHAWGMHWGGAPSGGPGGPGRDGWQRPAVVYNHTTYISRSTTVINRIDNTHISNNYGGTMNRAFAHNDAPQAAMAQMHARQPGFGERPSTPMTMPRFSANDARPGARPASQFGQSHANATTMERRQTSVSPGNRVTAHMWSEGRPDRSTQVEHQQVPHPAPQYSAQYGRERSVEVPVHPPAAESVQHRDNAEPRRQAPHQDFAQPHPAVLRDDEVQHRENAGPHPQAPRENLAQAHPFGIRQDEQHDAQPRAQLSAPRPSAPRPAAHQQHAENDNGQHRR